jgi:hypothetical protein
MQSSIADRQRTISAFISTCLVKPWSRPMWTQPSILVWISRRQLWHVILVYICGLENIYSCAALVALLIWELCSCNPSLSANTKRWHRSRRWRASVLIAKVGQWLIETRFYAVTDYAWHSHRALWSQQGRPQQGTDQELDWIRPISGRQSCRTTAQIAQGGLRPSSQMRSSAYKGKWSRQFVKAVCANKYVKFTENASAKL